MILSTLFSLEQNYNVEPHHLRRPYRVATPVDPASVTAINAVDADSLMAKLVSLSMTYYPKLNAEGKATPDEYAAWMTRAAMRGVSRCIFIS